ncbi:MAG: peptidoglycan DD-metalloendopeptidase family protein [Clostridiales bacterium]|nr:peptidoglycan DD-metalloendopeptidase family protein [Clostridiales bacterium]
MQTKRFFGAHQESPPPADRQDADPAGEASQQADAPLIALDDAEEHAFSEYLRVFQLQPTDPQLPEPPASALPQREPADREGWNSKAPADFTADWEQLPELPLPEESLDILGDYLAHLSADSEEGAPAAQSGAGIKERLLSVFRRVKPRQNRQQDEADPAPPPADEPAGEAPEGSRPTAALSPVFQLRRPPVLDAPWLQKLCASAEALLLFLLMQCYLMGLRVRKIAAFFAARFVAAWRTAGNFVHYRRWKKTARKLRTEPLGEDAARNALLPAPSFDVVAAFERMEARALARGISLLTGIPRSEIVPYADRRTRNRYLRTFTKRCTTVFIPAASVLLLCALLYSVRDYTLGIRVFLEGQEVALVKEEADYQAVVARVERYVSDITGTRYELRAVPTFNVALLNKNELGDYEALETALLQSAGDVIKESCGLYVDGQLIAVNDDGEALRQLLDSLKLRYAENPGDELPEFVQDVRVEPGLYARSLSKSLPDIEGILTSSVQEEVVYVIQPGDLMGTIAPRFDMTVAQLKALNPTVDERRLREGNELVVSRATPFLTIKAVKQLQYSEPIPFQREVQSDSSMYTYESKIKVKGQEGLISVVAEVCEIDGIEISRQELTRTVLNEPVTQVEIKGTKTPPATAPTGSFRQPVVGGVVTSRFGLRRGSQHTGIDIGLPVGTTIVAADGGTVTFAGWSGSYGYIVKISHGSSTETWYAHCSAMLVSAGDQVAKGQPIARVGNTGRSTGPHLHFEVRIGGRAVNPAPYIGR